VFVCLCGFCVCVCVFVCVCGVCVCVCVCVCDLETLKVLLGVQIPLK